MSLTLSEEKTKNLIELILKGSGRRSLLSNGQNLEKFLFSFFSKNIVEKSKIIENNDKSKIVKKQLNELKGYKILKVSKNYLFPSTTYKKDTPMLCAESAIKGIIRKNKLEDSDNFTFSITNNTKTLTYNYNNKKLEANHGRK